jgi:hypothetical protein
MDLNEQFDNKVKLKEEFLTDKNDKGEIYSMIKEINR